MARVGIISLLPLGLHMGNLWGVQPLGGNWLVSMWILYVAWLAVTLTAFFKKGTPQGESFLKIGDWTRYLLIPTLIIVGITSLLGYGPFEAGEGQKWFSAKIMLYGAVLIIGVFLRVVMQEWQTSFRILANGSNADVEAKLDKSIRLARKSAYLYWISIAGIGFLGAVKPF